MHSSLGRSTLTRAMVMAAAIIIAGCGGGGGSSAPISPAPGPSPSPATPPSISTQPQDPSAAAGSTVSVSVVSGNAAGYQWQRSIDGGATWADVAGANAATFTLASVALIDSGTKYRVTVSNNAGSLNSNPATLTVRPSLRLLAGALGGPGYFDAIGTAARFDVPRGLARDSAGNVYIADGNNHVIRRVTPAGVVSTFAGTPGQFGRVDGPVATARFGSPRAIAIDSSGTLWVVDQYSCYLRRIAAGMVTSFASLSTLCQLASGSSISGSSPAELIVTTSGDILVSDTGRHVILRVDSAGVVSVFAGLDGFAGSQDGPRLGSALFRSPRGLAQDVNGDIYVVDRGNYTLRRIATNGDVTTIAGSPQQFGHVDGVGPAARFGAPIGLALLSAGKLAVSQINSPTIRQVDIATATVTTIAGSPTEGGTADGIGQAARFSFPVSVSSDGAGGVFVSDGTLRRVSASAVVTTVAGQPLPAGSVDGSGAVSRFGGANGIASDAAGNVYVADAANHTVRKVTPAGVVTTLAGLAGTPGSADGAGSAARFNGPLDLTVDAAGFVYVADSSNYTVRRISPSGLVTTLAGQAGSDGDVDGSGQAARFASPYAIATHPDGGVVVADFYNCKIRRVLPSGVVSTLAGVSQECGGLDGAAGVARVGYVSGVSVDSLGSVVLAENSFLTGLTTRAVLRRLQPDGSIVTIAGASGPGEVDGPGATATFGSIADISIDSMGNLYVADNFYNSIRLVRPDGVVGTLIRGTPASNTTLGDPPKLRQPAGIAPLPSGAIAISSEAAILID